MILFVLTGSWRVLRLESYMIKEEQLRLIALIGHLDFFAVIFGLEFDVVAARADLLLFAEDVSCHGDLGSLRQFLKITLGLPRQLRSIIEWTWHILFLHGHLRHEVHSSWTHLQIDSSRHFCLPVFDSKSSISLCLGLILSRSPWPSLIIFRKSDEF